MIVTLIVRVGDLPDDTQVRKKTGQRLYRIKRKIVIYGAVSLIPPLEVRGMAFLVDDEGRINAVAETHEMAIDLSIDEAIGLLERIKEKNTSHQ